MTTSSAGRTSVPIPTSTAAPSNSTSSPTSTPPTHASVAVDGGVVTLPSRSSHTGSPAHRPRPYGLDQDGGDLCPGCAIGHGQLGQLRWTASPTSRPTSSMRSVSRGRRARSRGTRVTGVRIGPDDGHGARSAVQQCVADRTEDHAGALPAPARPTTRSARAACSSRTRLAAPEATTCSTTSSGYFCIHPASRAANRARSPALQLVRVGRAGGGVDHQIQSGLDGHERRMPGRRRLEGERQRGVVVAGAVHPHHHRRREGVRRRLLGTPDHHDGQCACTVSPTATEPTRSPSSPLRPRSPIPQPTTAAAEARYPWARSTSARRWDSSMSGRPDA